MTDRRWCLTPMPSLSARTREDAQINLAHLERFVVDETRPSWPKPEAGLIGLARLPDGISSGTIARRLLAAPY